MPRYKWDSAHEWFSEWSQKQSDTHHLLTLLAEKVDADTIQDLFQSDMEQDGYFEDLDKPKQWSSSSGRIVLEMTIEQAQGASHQGECDADVKALSVVPAIAKQLAEIDSQELSRELKEYGAWSDEERADHQQNLQRLLWLAAIDIMEEHGAS